MAEAATLQRKPAAPAISRPPAAALHPAPASRKTAAVPAYLQRARIQLAQAVSQPHDPAEREAEATARAVVSMAAPAPAVTPGAGIQRTGVDPTSAGPSVTSAIAEAGSSGAPLPAKVRSYMEPRFRANFGAVRIHTGDKAASLSRQLNARAFATGNQIFFGKGEFQPDTPAGLELIAHELTHTIQQGAAIQRKEAGPAVSVSAPRQIQRLGISDALDYFAGKANHIPGFRMFTIILGLNPINMSRVERSAANILRAVVEFLPGGALITQALDNHGVFDKVGAWVEQQINSLGMVGGLIRDAINRFLDSLGWSDILDLGGVWERAKRIFTEPIDKLKAFGAGLVDGIIKFVKDAILMPLARLAEPTRGWDLLCAVLGKNPITGEPVPPTAEKLVGGFMKFIGQEEVWQRIQETGAIAKVWAWFQGAMATVKAFVMQLPALALQAFKSLVLADIVLLPRAILKILAVFGDFALRFVTWAGDAVWKLLEIVFMAVSPNAWGYIRRTGAALKSILKNPLPFVGNLVKAAKLGLGNFADKIGTHLKAGLIDWLTDSLEGVYIPKAISLPEIGKFALSVLGVTWAQIRGKIVKALGPSGEKIMAGLETTFDVIVALVKGGPAAAWEVIKDKLTNLKDIVFDAIKGFVTDAIVKKAIPKLVALFIPGAGFISAIVSIYDMVMVFVEKLAKIKATVKAFVDSIADIAAGQIPGAAKKVETSLAGLLALAISFLAGFLGLGKITAKIKEVIDKVGGVVDKALNTAVAWIVGQAKKLGKIATEAAGAIIDWWKEKLGFTNKDGESHTLQFIGSGESAQMGVETTLTPVRTYLDNHPDKDSSDKEKKDNWNTAKSVFERATRVIFTSQAKTEAEKKRRQEVKDELAKVGAAFARLAGEPPTKDDYPKSAEPTYSPFEVEFIVGDAKQGTKPGAGANTGTLGWKEVYDAKLTKATDKWVQMHVISERLGGKGIPPNLIPAPNSINTGPFRTFELSTRDLAKAKSGKIKNVVWAKFDVEYSGVYARSIRGQSGLYFWKGPRKAEVSQKWLKNDRYSFYSKASIPQPPQLGAGKTFSLNFSSGTDLVRGKIVTDEKLVALIKQGRLYPTLAVFVSRIEARAAEAGVSDYKDKIQSIIGNPKVFLNEPPP
jgi:hypothetical protein